MNALKPLAPFHVLVMSEESRLGLEAIETADALKQLVTAGVRVLFYMEDRERTLDSPTDKIMPSLTASPTSLLSGVWADTRQAGRARAKSASLACLNAATAWSLLTVGKSSRNSASGWRASR
jgi:hypothetical protein